MEKTFFTDVLKSSGMETIIPNLEDREVIHDIIYGELAVGILNPTSKEKYLKIINKLIKNGAEGIILGCTEIPLLITQADVSVPVFDTTKIHSIAAFNF
jgi:aspartate racemase